MIKRVKRREDPENTGGYLELGGGIWIDKDKPRGHTEMVETEDGKLRNTSKYRDEQAR